jgi:hypothetical protein
VKDILVIRHLWTNEKVTSDLHAGRLALQVGDARPEQNASKGYAILLTRRGVYDESACFPLTPPNVSDIT